MIVLDILNKKGYSLDYKKTELFKDLKKNASIFDARKVEFKNKSMIDVFNNEILYKSIVCENKLHNIYELFVSESFDILKYVNYDEKRKMVNIEFDQYIPDFDVFKDQESNNIYMPMYEPFINVRMLSDYQSFELKQHKQYLTDFKITKDNPMHYYGLLPYKSSFSSLQFVKEVKGVSYFYFAETKSIYLFNDEYIGSFILTDKNEKLELNDISDLIEIMQLNDEQKLLDALNEKGYLSEKLYKKINKKVSKLK